MKDETLLDIISEMRERAQKWTKSEDEWVKNMLEKYADRIEEASQSAYDEGYKIGYADCARFHRRTTAENKT